MKHEWEASGLCPYCEWHCSICNDCTCPGAGWTRYSMSSCPGFDTQAGLLRPTRESVLAARAEAWREGTNEMTPEDLDAVARAYAYAHLKHVNGGREPEVNKVDEMTFFMGRYAPFAEAARVAYRAGRVSAKAQFFHGVYGGNTAAIKAALAAEIEATRERIINEGDRSAPTEDSGRD